MSTKTILETRPALPTGTWRLDPVHSHVGFAVEYGVGTFRGSFAPVEATLEAGEDGQAILTGTAPVAGIKVQDPNLLAHLQSPEFFDVERTPQIRFVSTTVERSGNDVKIAGELEIKGHTHSIEATGQVADPAEDAHGNVRFGLKLETTVDRTQFGLDWNMPLPNGQPALANEVTLTTELYFVSE
jgi:polyisoprenoid-binding protein YceI